MNLITLQHDYLLISLTRLSAPVRIVEVIVPEIRIFEGIQGIIEEEDYVMGSVTEEGGIMGMIAEEERLAGTVVDEEGARGVVEEEQTVAGTVEDCD